MKTWIRSHGLDLAMAGIGLGLAIALRFSLLDFKSGDYFAYTRDWYITLKSEGFAAFSHGFSNYNLPYLYLLYGVVRFLPDFPPVIAIKVPSLLADVAIAALGWAIVAVSHRGTPRPFVAALALLFAPTLVLNSAFWGQADAIYTCLLLASLLMLLLQRDSPALALFGAALAFKAQAVFLLPLYAALAARGVVRRRTLLWIPAVLMAALLPALVAGRPFMELLLIYPSQADQYQQLSMHAPSAWAWVPDSGRYFSYFYSASLPLAAAVILAFSWAVYRSPARITPRLLIELALISAVLVPFLLPKMHERYFYLADVLSILVVFFVPSLYFVPLLLLTASFFAYQPSLFGAEPVPIAALALGVFIALIALIRNTLPRLFPAPAED